MQYYYFFKQQYLLDSPLEDAAVLNTFRREWQDMATSPFEATFEGLHAWGSKAHCYGMFPPTFLSGYVLGIRPDGPVQRKTLLVEPRLGNLTVASGVVVTEFGPVEVSWRKGANGWAFRVSTKAKARIRLRLPDARSVVLDGVPSVNAHVDGRWTEFDLGPGEHCGSWSSSH